MHGLCFLSCKNEKKGHLKMFHMQSIIDGLHLITKYCNSMQLIANLNRFGTLKFGLRVFICGHGVSNNFYV